LQIAQNVGFAKKQEDFYAIFFAIMLIINKNNSIEYSNLRSKLEYFATRRVPKYENLRSKLEYS